MLDGWAKARIDPHLEGVARRLADAGISANQVTLAGFVVGLTAAV